MRVVVRARPSKDTAIECDPHVGSKIRAGLGTILEDEEPYEFAAVLGQQSTQREAFMCCGMPMLEAALDGQRACLFAYGQTGSGKTFSLLGDEGGRNPLKLDGIVPLMVSELFRRFATLEREGIKYNLWASFVEVYNEKTRDLLDEPHPYTNEQPILEVKTASANATAIDLLGAVNERVRSSRALTELINTALSRRVTDANFYHSHSSRSHALLTLTLERRVNRTSQTTSIHLVDLAGSESYNHVQPHAQINVSLLALGRVLTALARGHGHVPFRDSVLTRLLHGVVGEGGNTCMLACINPGPDDVGETHSVLEYAKVTASITTKVTKAEVKELVDSRKRQSVIEGSEGDRRRQSLLATGDAAAGQVDEPLLDLDNEDPMENDEYDIDESLMRRTEIVETREHGHVHARCVGDPENPLVLYLHGLDEGRNSSNFNDLVVGVSAAMSAEKARLAGGSKKKAEKKEDAKEGDAKEGKANTKEGGKEDEYELADFEGDEPLVKLKKSGKDKKGVGKEKRASGAGLKAKSSKEPSPKNRSIAVNGRSDSFPTSNRPNSKGDRQTGIGFDAAGGDDEEQHLAEAHDTRFFHLRAQLSAALLRAQRELSQTRCDQCQQQLRQPHRMLGCRHVICGLCAESTIRYWDECPFCGITTHTSRGDPCHAMVLRQREADWERLQAKQGDGRPRVGREGGNQADAWRSRLDIAIKEREASCRIVLEYGCELGESDKWGHAIGKLTAADTDKPRITWYLRVVGDQAQRGKKCVFDPGAGPPVEKVILNTTPSLPPSEDSTVTTKNSDRLGYTKTRTASIIGLQMCTITVHWHPDYGCAPLDIRVVNSQANFRRWIVVQLPAVQNRAKVPRNVPAVQFGDGEKPFASGWVCYQNGKEVRIYIGARSFGRAAPGAKPEAAVNNKDAKAAESDVEKAQREREQALTLAPLKPYALGRVAEVQRDLAFSAGSGVPLAKGIIIPPEDEVALLYETDEMANNGTKGRRSISPPPKKVQMLEDAIDAVSKEAEEDGAATGPKGEKPPLIVALDLFLKRKKMRPAALLKSWDDNGDGVIQREEWLQHIQIVCPGYEEKEILDLFDSLDEDKSGMLELIEIKHLPKNLITMQVDEVKKTEKEAQSLIEEREAQKLVATEELQTAESLAGKEYSALQSAEQDVNTAQGQLADWKSKLEALAPDAPEERRQKVMRSMALRVEELEECQQTLISARGRQEAADEALMQARSRVKQLDEELEAAKESKAAAKAKAKEHQQAQARAQAGSVVGIKDVQEAKDDKTGKPKGKDGKDEGPLSNCLLISAAAGSDAQIVSIYEQMINLVFKAPAATREKFLRQLPQLGERAEAAEVDACFHVAIDLFGFGKSAANAAAFRSLKTTPAVVLADIIRSLGKSHAYAMVAVEHSANIVVKALLDKPSLGSFVSLRDPYLENEDVLTRILQPVLVLSLNPQRMSVCRRVANSLQQGKFVDLTSKTAKKSEHAQALHVFLQEFNAQGSDPGVVGKKMPLLTRLAGGIKAWSEIPPKKPAGMPKPRMDNGFGSMKALPEFIVSAPKESKWDKFRKGDKEDPIEILSQRAPPKAQPAMPAKPPSTSSCPPSPRTKSPRSGSPRAKSPRNAKGGRRSNGKGSKKVSGSIKSA